MAITFPKQDHIALAKEINALLDRQACNRSEWIEIKLDLCALISHARAEFKDNKTFGKWFSNEFGGEINPDDRAAYIAMGADPARARKVLEATERTSIQMIFRKEFAPQPKAAKAKAGAKTKAGTKPGKEQAAPRQAPAPKPVLTQKEFNILVKVCHPDRHNNAPTLEQLNEAMAILNTHKEALCGPKQKPQAKPKANGSATNETHQAAA